MRELSERVAEAGLPMEAPVITNLELQRRGTISVPELFALGDALKVAPFRLLFPFGMEDVDGVELLPGIKFSVWRGLRYAEEGIRPLRKNEDIESAWEPDAGVLTTPPDRTLDTFRRHEEEVSSWVSLSATVERMQKYVSQNPDSDGAPGSRLLIEKYQENLGRIPALVQRLRAEMREQNLTPPELPATLEYLDEVDPMYKTEFVGTLFFDKDGIPFLRTTFSEEDQ